MPPRPPSDDLFRAVYELATVRPYQADHCKFVGREYRAYCEGYYCALQTSLRAMELALVKRKLRLRDRRRANAARKTA
jgi:hypothetical protein